MKVTVKNVVARNGYSVIEIVDSVTELQVEHAEAENCQHLISIRKPGVRPAAGNDPGDAAFREGVR